MTGPTLRERKKERTRAAIADVALRLFADRGFAAVTLADVAAAAEVGERTVYRYFADKEELLFGSDEDLRHRLADALDGRPADEPAATAVLEAALTVAPLWQDRQDEGRAREAVVEASPALRARQRAKHADLEAVLAAGLVARGTALPQARLLARAAVACTVEALTRWLADRDPARPGLAAHVRRAHAELAALLTPGA